MLSFRSHLLRSALALGVALLVLTASRVPGRGAGLGGESLRQAGLSGFDLPFAVAPAPSALAALPAGWPNTLQLGMASGPGEAAAMKATAPFGFRYQYLTGGANTGSGWATWDPDGSFVTSYIQESVTNGIAPVFTYYQVLQSAGPCSTCAEKAKDLAHLNDTATMTAIYNDLKLFYQRAAAFPNNLVVLHVEPDLWGYIQQGAVGDDAATVPAKVAATGLAELAGLPDNAAGFARAVRKLRDTYAPKVVLGYAVSIWNTNVDVQIAKPTLTQTDALATRSANFYRSLGTDFDVVFGEFLDRDAGFYQYQYGDGGASWMTADDFARHARYMSTFSSASGRRIVLWQIPYGNTKMLAVNNTWDHYQDNRVEWLLDDPARAHLNDYLQAGVVAFLFGSGADGTTEARDRAGDGVTSPPATNGNTGVSLNADDDGGFFRQKAAAYYSAGAMPLAGGSAPTTTPVAAATATMAATATAAPSATMTPVTAATATILATATVTPAATTTAMATPTMATPTGTATLAPSSTTTVPTSARTATPRPTNTVGPTVTVTATATPCSQRGGSAKCR